MKAQRPSEMMKNYTYKAYHRYHVFLSSGLSLRFLDQRDFAFYKIATTGIISAVVIWFMLCHPTSYRIRSTYWVGTLSLEALVANLLVVFRSRFGSAERVCTVFREKARTRRLDPVVVPDVELLDEIINLDIQRGALWAFVRALLLTLIYIVIRGTVRPLLLVLSVLWTLLPWVYSFVFNRWRKAIFVFGLYDMLQKAHNPGECDYCNQQPSETPVATSFFVPRGT